MAKTADPKPPKAVKNGARPPAKPAASDTLMKAIKSLSTELLRRELKFLCEEFPAIIPMLEGRLLVQGKDVVRYHADTDSEDHGSSEGSESESGPDSKLDSNGGSNKRKPIALGDDEYTARMATCKNCDEEFDVTSNERGGCTWHPGVKEVDHDSDFWADHDVDCHGPYEAFEDDSEYGDGFTWDCCDKPGDNEGCMVTKHKAKSNLVVPAPPPVPAPSKKRKVGEGEPGTSSKRGRRKSPN